MHENLNCTLLKINLHLPINNKTFIILTDNTNFSKTIFNKLESKILCYALNFQDLQNKQYTRYLI